MQVPRALATALAAASLVSAQDPTQYTDEDTGIEFTTWTHEGAGSYTFGIALPEDALETDANEYIGMLKCSSSASDKHGWCGYSHGQSGQMTQALLLVAWPYEDQVLTSLLYADGYTMPEQYTGDATVTQISSKVDENGYEIIYRCEGCFAWDHNGVAASVDTSKGYLVGGRAQSNRLPENANCPSDIMLEYHADGFGQWAAPLDNAVNPSYADWTALATDTVTGSCGGEPEPTETDTEGELEEESPVLEEESPVLEEESPVSTSSPSRAPSRPPSLPTRPSRPSRPTWPKFGWPKWLKWPKWPKPSRPSRPSKPKAPTLPTRPGRPSRPTWPKFGWPKWLKWPKWPKPSRPSRPSKPKGPSRPPRPTRIFWPEPEVPTETSRPPRPTPTVWPEPSEPTIKPEAPEEPAETPRPPRPTPTFWPDPWDSEEPSEAGTPLETPEVDFEFGDPQEPSETQDSEEQQPDEPVETDIPEEPEETEIPEVPGDIECTAVGEGDEFDYVIVGAGAGGITVAERLTAAGKKVLLIEKGPPSTARWGGSKKPEWLEGEDLTRFDVPGLCNQIWHDSTGIVCTDMDQFAGCVLGGGTAINAGLWWKPHPLDWDENFPAGWSNDDVAEATRRVFERIPGTTNPSMDGVLYQREGFDILADGLAAAGWEKLDAPNDHPDKKDRTFAHTAFMFENGERGGPLATYLVSASESPNFNLWTDTSVRRLVREGGRVTGVELQCASTNGHSGIIKVAEHGRVILSAGVFGSAKLLMRSGIGPADQLSIVANSALDGDTMIAEEEWIELPVGENLIDHLNTDVVVEHPDVVQYNYTEAWWDPIVEDTTAYLQDRSGILAAAAPNIGPMIWDEIEVSDGSTRSLQWTCRMEGSLNLMGNHTITMSQYLGRGVVSRGRMALTPALTTRVAALPYLTGNEGDLEAIIQGLDNIREALADVPGLKFLSPADNVTSAEYVDQMVVSVARRSNHWMGTNKMGDDDGREGGTAVVDANTKVYGMDNLFVVDGSVFPGMVTGNPSAMIVILAEHAADRILAL